MPDPNPYRLEWFQQQYRMADYRVPKDGPSGPRPQPAGWYDIQDHRALDGKKRSFDPTTHVFSGSQTFVILAGLVFLCAAGLSGLSAYSGWGHPATFFLVPMGAGGVFALLAFFVQTGRRGVANLGMGRSEILLVGRRLVLRNDSDGGMVWEVPLETVCSVVVARTLYRLRYGIAARNTASHVSHALSIELDDGRSLSSDYGFDPAGLDRLITMVRAGMAASHADRSPPVPAESGRSEPSAPPVVASSAAPASVPPRSESASTPAPRFPGHGTQLTWGPSKAGGAPARARGWNPTPGRAEEKANRDVLLGGLLLLIFFFGILLMAFWAESR